MENGSSGPGRNASAKSQKFPARKTASMKSPEFSGTDHFLAVLSDLDSCLHFYSSTASVNYQNPYRCTSASILHSPYLLIFHSRTSIRSSSATNISISSSIELAIIQLMTHHVYAQFDIKHSEKNSISIWFFIIILQ